MTAFPPGVPSVRPGPIGGALRSHRGPLILALGILSLIICFICGIVAWIMANNDLAAMDSGTMDPSGRSLTNAGKIVGIIGTALGGLAVVGGIIWLVVAGAIFGAAAAGAAAGPGAGPLILP